MSKLTPHLDINRWYLAFHLILTHFQWWLCYQTTLACIGCFWLLLFICVYLQKHLTNVETPLIILHLGRVNFLTQILNVWNTLSTELALTGLMRVLLLSLITLVPLKQPAVFFFYFLIMDAFV